MINRLRFILILLALTTLSTAYSQETASNTAGIKWMSFEEAVKLNAGFPKKKVFIDVFTSWCGWCKKMDAETFRDPGIVQYMNEHYYAVKLDAERKDTVEYNGRKLFNPNPGASRSAHQLAINLLQGQMSYPSYVILDENNQKITAVPGYLKAADFLPILSYFGSNQHFVMSWEAFLKQYQNPAEKKE